MAEMSLLYLSLLVWTLVYMSASTEQTSIKSDEYRNSVNNDHVISQTTTKAYEKTTSANKGHVKLKTKRNPNTSMSSTTEHVNSQMFTMPYKNATLVRRQDVFYKIGKKLCPYSDYCQRKKTMHLGYRQAACCADCSCEDNCWETGTCCPDKESIVEREPVRRCHASIVKAGKSTTVYNGIKHGIWAYYIIDNCPDFEQNISIINKCTLSDIDHFNDYRWVSDNATDIIYQNKFCAACHGKNGLTEWRLETRCKELLLSDFSRLNSLLLSGKCDIINREPGTEINNLYERCAIPFYTRCNQTGLWTNYDPDIKWACDIHNSVFFEYNNRNVTVYKNAFCYACNVPVIKNAPTTCLYLNAVDQLTFSALIDYKRYEHLNSDLPSTNMPCKVNEIMDEYMEKCRSLICPFGQAPYYGQCEQLVEKTHGLSLEVLFSLTALWSKVDYTADDNLDTFIDYGKLILLELAKRYVTDESGISCPVCNQSLRFIKEIVRSHTTHNYSATQFVGTTNLTKYTEPNLLFHVISFTEKDCQLQNLLANADKLSESVIDIHMNGELLMLLQVDLVTESTQSLISDSRIIVYVNFYPNCFVTFQMKTIRTCPRIKIRYSEFEPLMTENNSGIIKGLFTAPPRSSEDSTEICVNDYLVKLGKRMFKVTGNTRNSGSFGIALGIIVLMSMIGIAQQLLL